jgi:hypothetical protein
MLMIRRLRMLLKNATGCFEIFGMPLEEGGESAEYTVAGCCYG